MSDAHDDQGAPLYQDGDEAGAEGLIRHAMDVVNMAKSMPLSASAIVSREELVGILGEALEKMPDELREARWLLREKDEFLSQQKREADSLMEEVRAQAAHMVSRTEVVRQANQMAQKILADANEEARRLRHEVEDYCDQKLAGMEIVLDRIVRTVQAGREKLHATIAGSQDQARQDAQLADDPESFFDQDIK
jgi:dsDNA-specific endonuclease/ATPase MutS2